MSVHSQIRTPQAISSRVQPHSLEAEEYLLSCCLIDGNDTLTRCLEGKVTSRCFYAPANQIIFEKLIDMHNRGVAIEAGVLAEELKTSRQLDDIGGFSYLTQISGRIPTTAKVDYFIEKVREYHIRREFIAAAATAIEDCYSSTDDADPLLASFQSRLEAIATSAAPTPGKSLRGLFDFKVPPDNDPNTLLGNRYLVRGDGAFLVSTSGVGKSSITPHAATLWALGRPFFGIKPHGPLRSLIIQSEDSDGDVAEVAHSIAYSLNLTDEERALVNKSVVIKTERKARGFAFLAVLRAAIREHKPDLVWINPLLAFMDGDIKEADDAGKFLREGLNALNDPASFAYIVVHHTNKPAKRTNGKPAAQAWNEVMYDMAGSADLTNWARAIISLRPTNTYGEFDLVLAKRGARAGVVREVEHSGLSKRIETVTTIPIKYATGSIQVEGRARPMPRIFWEPREADAIAESPTSRNGRPKSYTLTDFKEIIPRTKDAALDWTKLAAAAKKVRPVAPSTFYNLIKESVDMGFVICDKSEGKSRYYLHTP